jgi:Carboxypeptidase regulatory-like domain
MSSLSTLVRALLLSTILCFVTSSALAQYGASIEGTVTDKSGAVIGGANVTVTDEATGVTHSTVSSQAGFYRVTGLPPAHYKVEADAGNFKKSSRTVDVVNETPTNGDVTLQTGSATETITVTGTSEGLQTEDATIQGTLSTVEVENLPAINRDPYELLRLSPGVFGDGARFGDGRSGGFPNGAGAVSASAGPGGSSAAIFQVENQQPISANGQRVTSNDYLVDGVSVNSLEWGGAAVITPSIESVQEISVLANDYDASDGRSSGAHIKNCHEEWNEFIARGRSFPISRPEF